MTYTPFVIAWGVMALIVALMIAGRTVLGFNEDDSLHLSQGQVSAERDQVHKAHQLEALERWSKILTIATVVYGLVLLGMYSYQQLT
jgi:hypothetical protein